MLLELSHLQEVVDQLEKHTADPFTLPPASEQVHASQDCLSLTLLSLVSTLRTYLLVFCPLANPLSYLGLPKPPIRFKYELPKNYHITSS